MATDDNDSQTWAQVMADNAVNVGDRDNDTIQTMDAMEAVATNSESGDNDRNADIEADVGSAVSESAFTQTRVASRRPIRCRPPGVTKTVSKASKMKEQPLELKPTVGDNNEISIASDSESVDIKLWLQTIDADKIAKRVELMAGADEKVFAALFDDCDHDFEIVVRNDSRKDDLWLEITYERMRKFVITCGDGLTLKTLDDNGYRLRFLTPNRPMGQTFRNEYPAGEVDTNTTIHFVSDNIGFDGWFGTCVGNKGWPEDEPRAKRVKREEGVDKDVSEQIGLKVRVKESTSVEWITIGRNQTVAELKGLIADRIKMTPARQRLVANSGTTLEDSQTIDECQLEDKSTVLVFCESIDEEMEKPEAERHVYIKNEKIHAVSTSGESGALGYGQRTSHCFGPNLDFRYYREYKVQDFKIELRLKRAYDTNNGVVDSGSNSATNAANASTESPQPSTSGCHSIVRPVVPLIELSSDDDDDPSPPEPAGDRITASMTTDARIHSQHSH